MFFISIIAGNIHHNFLQQRTLALSRERDHPIGWLMAHKLQTTIISLPLKEVLQQGTTMSGNSEFPEKCDFTRMIRWPISARKAVHQVQ